MEFPGTFTEAPITAFVHRIRRDGKHPVTYVFPLSNRSIKKLVNAKELQSQTYDKGYRIIFVND